jgi:hypothetical protein
MPSRMRGRPAPSHRRTTAVQTPIVTRKRLQLLGRFAAIALSFAVATPIFAAPKKNPSSTPKPTATPGLIEETGTILDVKLFGSIEEAREKMAHLEIDKDATPAALEKWKRGGSRIAWRLAETEYLWIVAWADSEGKIERISASVRPEQKKPFKEIGDLSRAKVHNESMAMWIVERPDGSNYRLVAKGPKGQAVTIYMYSLKNLQSD